MASYSLTRYVTDPQNSVDDALALIEAKVELVDTGKTIRAIGVYPHGKEAVGYVIYDT